MAKTVNYCIRVILFSLLAFHLGCSDETLDSEQAKSDSTNVAPGNADKPLVEIPPVVVEDPTPIIEEEVVVDPAIPAVPFPGGPLPGPFPFPGGGGGGSGHKAKCGDDVTEGNEECDDGNKKDGDGCSRKCKKEDDDNGRRCGNGEVEDEETCDGGDNCTDDCDFPIFDRDIGEPLDLVMLNAKHFAALTTASVELGFTFPLQGNGSHSEAHVNSNGNITFDSADSDSGESVEDFLSGPPRLAGLWDELDPAGPVYFKAVNDPPRAVFTWNGVTEDEGTQLNTFQIQINDEGKVLFSYAGISLEDGLVGVTPGGGVDDPGESDLSGDTEFSDSTVYELFTDSDPFDLDGEAVYFVPDGDDGWTATRLDVPAAVCGNGVVESGEECDDDNDDDDDECSNDCEVNEDQEGGLTLTKSADPTSFTAVEDPITYTITVTNNSTQTINDIDVDDTFFNGDPLELTCPEDTDLEPTESFTCTAEYNVTQDDIDAGEITNTAVATGTDENEDTVTSNEVTVTVEGPTANPKLTIDKTGVVDGDGDIDYTITIENTGNVTIEQLAIVDDFNPALNFSCIPALADSIAPGDEVVCTAEFDVPVDSTTGEFINTAHVTGQDLDGNLIQSNEDTVIVEGPGADPALSVLKEADTESYSGENTEIGYTVTITNEGNVSISNIEVTDVFTGNDNTAELMLNCGEIPTVLGPGEFFSCSATYTTTINDDETITNTTNVSGTRPAGGDPVTATGFVDVTFTGGGGLR